MTTRLSCALLIIALFGLCVFFKLNGSSVGIWDQLYGHEGKKSKGLLLFKPQQVRSDEWAVWTPATLSQARQTPPFPVENFSLGGGWAPLLLNLPVAYYTTLFRPQFWGFFLFDFERGFSFVWCAKVFGLLLATSWLFRQLAIRSRVLSLLGTLWIFLSLQWWFSSPQAIPEAIATWAICTCCAIEFLKQTSRLRLALAFATFVYCGVNFILCLYPPVQIPLLFLMMTIFIGVSLEWRRENKPCAVRRGILLLCAGIALIVIVLLPFWIDIRPTLETVAHTVYPGARRTSGGRLSLFAFFSGTASFFLTENVFPRFFANVCEAYHSFPLWPLVIFALVYTRFRQEIKISPLFIALGILIVGLAVYCLVPLPDWLLRVTLLAFTHEKAAMASLALASICLSCLFLDRYRNRIFSIRVAVGAAVGFCVAMTLLFWTASMRHPGLFPDRQQMVLSFAASAALIVLFFWETHRFWFSLVFIVLMVLSNIWVNPVMTGLSPLLDSQTFQTIDRIRATDPKAKWIVYNALELSEFIPATGAEVIGGTKIVPDLEFLHRLDPEGRATFIYNRYAHVLCRFPPSPGEMGFFLMQSDLYAMEIDPNLPVLQEIGCRYFVLPEYWPESEVLGFTLLEKVSDSSIWIYRRH
jgi:hypothetical protein